MNFRFPLKSGPSLHGLMISAVDRNSRSFTQRSRDRIIAAKLVDRLIKFVNGEIEMTRQQTQVGMKLVDKVLPSLKSVLIEEVEPERKPLLEMTDAELTARRNELLDLARGATYEETGYIHKDDLEKMGYIRQKEMELQD